MYRNVISFKRILNLNKQSRLATMKTLSKLERLITVLALVPLSSLEQKEREKKLNERLKRSQQKTKF